jgi:flagellar M-ring protein FliF
VKDDGSTEKTPYTDEDIARFESLVKETIGFSQNRGDSVSVINQPFVPNEVKLEEVPAWKSLLDESWIVTLAKQILGAIGLLIVYLIFGRPFLRSLNPNRVEVDHAEGVDGGEGGAADGAGGRAGYAGGHSGELAGPSSLSGSGMQLGNESENTAAMIRHSDATHEQKVSMAKTLVMDDPARVANVVNNWVQSEQ